MDWQEGFVRELRRSSRCRWDRRKHSNAGAIVVAERSIGDLRGGTQLQELARRQSVGKHHDANNSGVVQTHPVAEFVREKRFQLVRRGTLSGGKSRWRGEGYFTAIAEKRAGIEDAAGKYGWPAGSLELTPGAFATNLRVNASTPAVNLSLDGLKQILFSPSTLSPASSVQESVLVSRAMGAASPGYVTELNVVPVTPAQTQSESGMDCSIPSS